jgi:hypothetical protein
MSSLTVECWGCRESITVTGQRREDLVWALNQAGWYRMMFTWYCPRCQRDWYRGSEEA